MDTLFVAKDARLSREDSTLIVTPSGQRKRRIPIEGLRHVVVAGEAQLTTAVLGLCGRGGVRVTVLDWHGNVAGSFEPAGSSASGRVRTRQSKLALDPASRLDLARRFVEGAARNIRANLRYRAYRGNERVQSAISAIDATARRLPEATAVEVLMGFEGQIRGFYYDAWPDIDHRLAFGARRRRPPNNPINCFISWFNGLAYVLVRNELAKTHLDDCVSFLHAATEARSSLALDLAEVFKPALCDTLIFEIVLRDQIDDGWFHQEDGVCRLSEHGRVATLERWVQKVEASQSGPSYRDLVRAEALAVERHVLGIAPYVAWTRKV